MTTTCEHGRERATCPECGTLVITPRQEAELKAKMKAAVDEKVDAEFGKMRPLTDVEEQWVRMKHSDLGEEELQALIAEGLPADVTPITREDLPTKEPDGPHAFSRAEWDQRKKKRKISAANRARNRRVKRSRGKHATKKSAKKR